MDTLEQARAEIDAVDGQLAALFERDEKMNQLKRDLEEGLFDFSIKTRILTNQEVLAVLKNLINFKD